MIGKTKNVFAGSNTSLGFYSFYHYLVPFQAERFFIIKGGPGVGKSSFMRKIGDTFTEKGYDIELHHCSSDNNSIDGVVIPALKVALVDGTSPHTMDPKYPAVVDEIVNLGEYWDTEKILPHKKEVIHLTDNIKGHFNRAYKFLSACKPIMEDIIDKHKKAMDFSKVNTLTYNLIEEIFKDTIEKNRLGRERHLFSSALTPNGHVDYTDSILQSTDNVYYIEGYEGTGKTTMLKKISHYALDKGYDVELYHSPLLPHKLETLIINDLNIALTSNDTFNVNCYKMINMNAFINMNKMQQYSIAIEESYEVLNQLVEIALNNIRLAKLDHDGLEKYYIGSMDFKGVEQKEKEIEQRILSLIDDDKDDSIDSNKND